MLCTLFIHNNWSNITPLCNHKPYLKPHLVIQIPSFPKADYGTAVPWKQETEISSDRNRKHTSLIYFSSELKGRSSELKFIHSNVRCKSDIGTSRRENTRHLSRIWNYLACIIFHVLNLIYELLWNFTHSLNGSLRETYLLCSFSDMEVWKYLIVMNADIDGWYHCTVKTH